MESDDEGNDAIAMENIFEGLNGVGAMEGVNGAEAMEGVTGVAAVDVVTEVAAMEGLTRAGANQGGRKRTHCHCNSLKTAQVTLKMETVENANQGSTSVPTAVNVVDPVTLPTDQPPVATENAPTADPTDLPPRPSKKRKANASGPRRTSPAWESFTRVPESVSPEPQAACNYCDKRNEEDDSLMKMKAAEEALEEKQKVKPSFELSGKLAAETNRVRGITLLFNEPPEARKPDIKWRLYVFKTGEMLNEPLYIHRQSCYLFGRERRVADIPTDHPSCSKQHAVIQFRQVEKEQPDGMIVKQTRPYIMDLGSTNKTFVNDSPIEPQRYYELREQDTIKFGNSSREYVLLHENSASAS